MQAVLKKWTGWPARFFLCAKLTHHCISSASLVHLIYFLSASRKMHDVLQHLPAFARQESVMLISLVHII